MFASVYVARVDRKGLACALAAVGLFFVAVQASASSRPSRAQLAGITKRGVLLAEYDTAAWRATDAVQAAHPIEGRGWRIRADAFCRHVCALW
jgi:hypothetical protein